KGGKVLGFLCRLSLEPDSCVRTAEGAYARHGALALVVAKFVPGLNTVGPPLAGIFGMRRARFALFDGMGALLWSGSLVGTGYLFSSQLEVVALHLMRLGTSLAVLAGGSLAGFLAWKWLQRRRFVRQLRV